MNQEENTAFDGTQAKKLILLDYACNLSRHITVISSNHFLLSISNSIKLFAGTQFVEPAAPVNVNVTPPPNIVTDDYLKLPVPLIQHIDLIPERAFTESPAPFDDHIAPVNANAHVAPAPVLAQNALPSAATGFASPQLTSFAVEVSASQAVGSFPAVDESTPPLYKQVHQEQIPAEPESLERTQRHVPIPQIQEQLVEGVKEIPQAVEQRVGIPITAAHAADRKRDARTCCQFYSACSSDERHYARVCCSRPHLLLHLIQ